MTHPLPPAGGSTAGRQAVGPSCAETRHETRHAADIGRTTLDARTGGIPPAVGRRAPSSCCGRSRGRHRDRPGRAAARRIQDLLEARETSARVLGARPDDRRPADRACDRRSPARRNNESTNPHAATIVATLRPVRQVHSGGTLSRSRYARYTGPGRGHLLRPTGDTGGPGDAKRYLGSCHRWNSQGHVEREEAGLRDAVPAGEHLRELRDRADLPGTVSGGGGRPRLYVTLSRARSS